LIHFYKRQLDNINTEGEVSRTDKRIHIIEDKIPTYHTDVKLL